MLSKKLYLIAFLLICGYCINAQSIGSSVLSSAGDTGQQGSVQLSWSLGEMAISRWPTPSGGSVTEGFHQPMLQITQIASLTSIQVRIAPNPVQSKLQLIVDAKEEKDLTVALINVEGKILLQIPHVGIGNTEMDIHHLPSGIYFLSLRYTNEAPTQTFKLVKVQ